MIELIIPPIIIIVIIALLIVLLTKALRQSHDTDLQLETYSPKKRRWISDYTSRATTQLRVIKDKTEKFAQKRRITAAVEEARTNNKIQQSPIDEQISIDEYTQRQRMSRMGEIILNYHRDAADSESGNHHDPAEAHLIQSVERDPQNPDGYERLGDFYMEKQNFEDARECYKYVLRLDPRHRRAQEAMKNLDRVLG